MRPLDAADSLRQSGGKELSYPSTQDLISGRRLSREEEERKSKGVFLASSLSLSLPLTSVTSSELPTLGFAGVSRRETACCEKRASLSPPLELAPR